MKVRIALGIGVLMVIPALIALLAVSRLTSDDPSSPTVVVLDSQYLPHLRPTNRVSQYLPHLRPTNRVSQYLPHLRPTNRVRAPA